MPAIYSSYRPMLSNRVSLWTERFAAFHWYDVARVLVGIQPHARTRGVRLKLPDMRFGLGGLGQ
jgi:hypothetical protein